MTEFFLSPKLPINSSDIFLMGGDLNVLNSCTGKEMRFLVHRANTEMVEEKYEIKVNWKIPSIGFDLSSRAVVYTAVHLRLLPYN